MINNHSTKIFQIEDLLAKIFWDKVALEKYIKLPLMDRIMHLNVVKCQKIILLKYLIKKFKQIR